MSLPKKINKRVIIREESIMIRRKEWGRRMRRREEGTEEAREEGRTEGERDEK